MRLDAPLDAVEVRVRADRHSGRAAAGPAGVDAVGRDEQSVQDVEIRSRKPELTAASVPTHDDALHLWGPPEQRRRTLHLTGVDELPDPARGDVCQERHAPHVEAEALEQLQIALATVSETERLSRG